MFLANTLGIKQETFLNTKTLFSEAAITPNSLFLE